jgi:hypothetical protein
MDWWVPEKSIASKSAWLASAGLRTWANAVGMRAPGVGVEQESHDEVAVAIGSILSDGGDGIESGRDRRTSTNDN